MRNKNFLALLIVPLVFIAASFGENSFTSGPLRTPPAAETITDGATITADGCWTLKRITSGGAVTTDTTNTFTAPSSANAGCVMFLVNAGSNNITLDANSNFVSAAAGNVVVTANDTLAVGSDGSKWYQLSALLAN